MMSPELAEEWKSEILTVRDTECIATINRIRGLLDSTPPDVEMLRLMSIPMLYSVWERAFSNWTGMCLKVVQDRYLEAIDCPAKTRVYWLRKADFFRSFVDSIRDVMELEREDSIFYRKKATKGSFNLSTQVLSKLDEWHRRPLSHCDFSSLVITYSNVNDHVVKTNAEAIGLADLPSYSQLDLSQLGELVGIRNGIGHGSSLQAPGARKTIELIDYTNNLINQYADLAIEWIQSNIDIPENIENNVQEDQNSAALPQTS